MNKTTIIKLLTLEQQFKSTTKYSTFIKNLKKYSNKINYIEDLENVDDFNDDIYKRIKFLYEMKNLILETLELIKLYNMYKNKPEKTKLYDNAIKFVQKIVHYKEIKGLDIEIMKIINELTEKGGIKYLKYSKDTKFQEYLKKNMSLKKIKISKYDNDDNDDKKNLIIKNLEIIKNYKIFNNELIKARTYEIAINNIKLAKDLKNLKEIKGVGITISKMIYELLKTGKINYIENVINKDEEFILYQLNKPKFDKKTIIKHLEIIRNYELFINNIDKAKIYSIAIGNIYKYTNDIKTLKDLKEIKGIGTAITFLLNELKNKGTISYIETIIKKNKKFKNKLENYNINKEILIEKLELIKDYETYNNEPYKIKAYNNAINFIIVYPTNLETIEDIYKLEGIGERILEKIYELYLTGKISYIDDNIKNDKLYLFKLELLEIHGIGPKNAKKIIDNGITSINQLKKNTNLLNSKQKIGLKYYDDFKKRIPIQEYEKHIKIIKKGLNNLTYDFVGSYRRGSKSMGDIDVIIMANPKFNLKKYIEKLKEDKYIIDVLAVGTSKFMGIVKIGNNPARRFDILIAPPDEYYYSLLYFTGSNIFNIGLRHYVKTKFNLSLSEHGFLNKQVPVKNEEDIFKYLKLKYVKPSERNSFLIN